MLSAGYNGLCNLTQVNKVCVCVCMCQKRKEKKRAVSQAVIQPLTTFMVSEQSTSASTLMETQVQDALANTSPNVTLGADATVQGSVASIIHSLSDSEISTPRSSTHADLSGTYPDRPTTRKLADVVTHLMGFSLQPTSLPTYRRAWKLYNTFSIDIFGQSACPLPLPPSNLAIFIAYLHQHNYPSSTVNTYVSALGYIHRLAGVDDPTKVFFIMEMLKPGMGKLVQGLTHAFLSQFPS